MPPSEPIVHVARGSTARRIARNALPYSSLIARALGNGIALPQLLRTQWPFLLPDAAAPPFVTIEFTNECQLKCVYCDNPLRLIPRGFMSRTTFANVVNGIRDLQSIVKVVGNGECTLHPDFRHMIRELSDAARYLFVLTNGNWRDPSIAHDLLRADAVGLSIDAGTKEEYIRACKGAIAHIYSSWKKDFDEWGMTFESMRGPSPGLICPVQAMSTKNGAQQPASTFRSPGAHRTSTSCGGRTAAQSPS